MSDDQGKPRDGADAGGRPADDARESSASTGGNHFVGSAETVVQIEGMVDGVIDLSGSGLKITPPAPPSRRRFPRWRKAASRASETSKDS